MKKLPILADFHYDRIGSWRTGNPFSIAFCYTNTKYSRVNEFIIKGGARDVARELKHLYFPMIVFQTYWWHGISRHLNPSFKNFKGYTKTGNYPHVNGLHPWKINHRHFYKYYEIRFMQKVWMTIRRIPRKWLPEYDLMIEAQHPVPEAQHPVTKDSVFNTIGPPSHSGGE